WPQLHALPCPLDCFGMATGKIVRGRQARAEEAGQWIARTHPHPLTEIAQRFVRLPVENEGPAGIAEGGGEVRVEIARCLEVAYRFGRIAFGNGQIAKRHVGPRIAVIEFGRPMRKARSDVLVTGGGHPTHLERDEKGESQDAVRWRIVWMAQHRLA